MPIVLLIRHSESQSNAGMPTLYPSVVELTEKGWEQAKKIPLFLQRSCFYPELIVTSSYLRTKQTAAPTILAYVSVREEEWPVHEFTYLSTWHEAISTVEDRQPMVDAYWELSDPAYVDGESSESFEQFIARVREVKRRLASSHINRIAVFSHQQFISAFLWVSLWNKQELTPDAMKSFRAFLKAHPIPNAAIVWTQLHNGQEQTRRELIIVRQNKSVLVSPGRR
jgi:probable phosphoglycerate mutase